MRRWSLPGLALVALLAISAAGCGDNTTPVTPTPTPELKTDTFTGTLTPGITNYYTFLARTGDVVMKLSSVTPDPTVKVGMTLGVYSYLTCTPAMQNTNAVVGNTLFGTATATTSMCITVYDNGSLTSGSSVNYTITVTHY